MELRRPAVSALVGLLVVVVIIAAAFYVTIPMVATSSSTSIGISTTPSGTTSGTTSVIGGTGTLTISSKQPLIISPGTTEAVPLKLTAVGTIGGTFTLSASSLPSGVTATFQPSSLNLPSQLSTPVTMTLAAGSGVAPSNATINVQATAGSTVFTSQFTLQAVQALVIIQGNAFNPSSLTVKSGTTVYWLNLDASGGGDVNSQPHDVTAADGSFSSGNANLQQYAVYSHTFTAAGTYQYKSSAQPSMTGQIVVAG